jgi:hypothetical protein
VEVDGLTIIADGGQLEDNRVVRFPGPRRLAPRAAHARPAVGFCKDNRERNLRNIQGAPSGPPGPWGRAACLTAPQLSGTLESLNPHALPDNGTRSDPALRRTRRHTAYNRLNLIRHFLIPFLRIR